jgi:hypothetical protein
MERLMGRLLIVIAALVVTAPAMAHHSFVAQYDATKQVTLVGTITKVEWTNPHAFFFIDVKDDQGRVVNWTIEGGAPNVLYREGWKPTTLKAGDQVTVTMSLARDGSKQGNAMLFKLPDGRCVFAGTSGPQGTGTDNCTPGRR